MHICREYRIDEGTGEVRVRWLDLRTGAEVARMDRQALALLVHADLPELDMHGARQKKRPSPSPVRPS